MNRRRKTFIRHAWDERDILSPAQFALTMGAIVLTLACMLVILVGGPLATPGKAPGTLGPERSDRAYCWYVSDPCSPHNQLPTK